MIVSAEQVAAALPWRVLIDALDDIFTRQVVNPIRHHHAIQVPDSPEATLLLMPCWLEGEYLGVKQVNVFPGNGALGLPGLTSHYLLSDAKTGLHLAQMDGNEITGRRTAAAAALGARYLARKDSKRLLIVGTGRIARKVIPAMCCVLPIEQIDIWNVRPESAEKLAHELTNKGLNARCVTDLSQAVGEADVISCSTLSTTPLIYGEWVRPGTHIDLIGSFTPTMREANNTLMQKAAVFADIREAALHETGDLIIPIEQGAITEKAVLADFFDFCNGRHAGRDALAQPQKAITVFKAVGSSIEDLAAAIQVYETLKEA